MSVSNYLCREPGQRAYVQYWVPVQYNIGFGGIIPALQNARHVLNKVVNGGTVEEHRLFALLMSELKDDAVNMAKYAKDGATESHLEHLEHTIHMYEEEYHRAHPGMRPLPAAAPPPPPPPAAPAPLYSPPPPIAPTAIWQQAPPSAPLLPAPHGWMPVPHVPGHGNPPLTPAVPPHTAHWLPHPGLQPGRH